MNKKFFNGRRRRRNKKNKRTRKKRGGCGWCGKKKGKKTFLEKIEETRAKNYPYHASKADYNLPDYKIWWEEFNKNNNPRSSTPPSEQGGGKRRKKTRKKRGGNQIGDECPICTEIMTQDQENIIDSHVGKNTEPHFFHKECINWWWPTNTIAPNPHHYHTWKQVPCPLCNGIMQYRETEPEPAYNMQLTGVDGGGVLCDGCGETISQQDYENGNYIRPGEDSHIEGDEYDIICINCSENWICIYCNYIIDRAERAIGMNQPGGWVGIGHNTVAHTNCDDEYYNINYGGGKRRKKTRKKRGGCLPCIFKKLRRKLKEEKQEKKAKVYLAERVDSIKKEIEEENNRGRRRRRKTKKCKYKKY